MKSTSKNYPLLRDLSLEYNNEELEEAQVVLKSYLALVWRIYQRVSRENPKKLTRILLNAKFKRGRS